jgi:hypothetical protein
MGGVRDFLCASWVYNLRSDAFGRIGLELSAWAQDIGSRLQTCRMRTVARHPDARGELCQNARGSASGLDARDSQTFGGTTMKAMTIGRTTTGIALMALAGAVTVANAQSAPGPAMKVGDRWVYNVKSGFGLATTTYQETREVTAVAGGGFKVTVTGKTENGADFTRVEDFSGPGTLRSGALCADEVYRYPTPLQRVAFPIAPGQRSHKWVDVVSVPAGAKGQINYSVNTRSWEKVTTPAGTFDAIRIDVLMTLDDSTPFRSGTNCNFTYWYSPAARGTVRERRSAQYVQITTDPQQSMPVLNASYELASFTSGKP